MFLIKKSRRLRKTMQTEIFLALPNSLISHPVAIPDHFLLQQPTVYPICYPNLTLFPRNPSSKTSDDAVGALPMTSSHKKDAKRSSGT